MATEEQPKNSEANQAARLEPYRFKPGQSGNPGGRPKGRSLTERLREIMAREAKDGKDYGDLLMNVLVKEAMTGNMKAIGYILDRHDGKVVQQINVRTTEGDEPRIAIPGADERS